MNMLVIDPNQPDLFSTPETSFLFLDIDDVLCLHRPYGGLDVIEAVHGRHPKASDVFNTVFDPVARDVLSRIHETLDGRLRYVISSTWRELLDREQMSTVFRKGGLGFVADALLEGGAWCTPVKLRRLQRVDEIAAWMDRHHRGEPFAIVDDVYSGASLDPALTLPAHPFHGRVVLCEESVGLGDEHVQTLIDALERRVVTTFDGEGV